MKKTKKNKHRKVSLYAILGVTVFLLCASIVSLTLNNSKQSNEQHTYAAGLGKNLYGIAAGSTLFGLNSTDLNRHLDDYKALGAQWIRFDFEWPTIQSNNATSYNWTITDPIVTAANAHGLKILGIIDYTPQWELPSGCTDSYHCPPKSNVDYATYATALVNHYAPMGVHYWELWNEPNGGTFTVSNYTNLIKLAYPAIKNADPTAFVLAGSTEPAATSGTSYSPLDFLTGIYQNGGKGYFDAVSHHPYCWTAINAGYPCPETSSQTQSWSAWSQMQDTNPSMRSIMIANGDGAKQIWATEFGAPTGGAASYGTPITEAQQAQMVTDGYSLFNSYSWAGPLFWYTYKDPCTTTTDVECYFGLVHTDYSPKPAYAVYQNLANANASPTATPIVTLTMTPTMTVTPTLTPIVTSTPTPTIISGSTKVVSLSENGTSARNPVTVNFSLNTTGNLSVNSLIVAVRDQSNHNFDIVVKTNTTLSGAQSFIGSRSLARGTYRYWIAYYVNGLWTNLSPTKNFQLSR